MPRFFTAVGGQHVTLTGEDVYHIARSLRMKKGEEIILCDGQGTDYFGVIKDISGDRVEVKIINSEKTKSEPDIKVTLFQALPKGDKMEDIIKKSVELGVFKIVPFISERCISRPKAEAGARKRERWQKIALEAAKQSQRGIVPQVGGIIGFSDVLQQLSGFTHSIMFYEGQARPLSEVLNPGIKEIGILIGAEGGFSDSEVKAAQNLGIPAATLGPRILRCETAPICALSVIMYATGQMK